MLVSQSVSSVAELCPTLCDPMNCSTPGLPVHQQLGDFTQTHTHQVGDAIQPSHPLSSPSLLAPNPSQHHGLFQWVNSSHEVAKVLEFQLQHQSFQWTPRTLISFRMDWLDLFAVQGTLKSLLQHHSSKASILWCSAFLTVQLSHPYTPPTQFLWDVRIVICKWHRFTLSIIDKLFLYLLTLLLCMIHQNAKVPLKSTGGFLGKRVSRMHVSKRFSEKC